MSYPNEVIVSPGAYSRQWVMQGGSVDPYTTLFRLSSRLDTVIDLAVHHRDDSRNGEQFRVLSVGCSYGAEVDSALAYLDTKFADLGRISITGIDTNPRAIAAAEEASYVDFQSRQLTESEELDDIPEMLTPFSLDVTTDKTPKGDLIHSISSRRLRSRHDVRFLVADLSIEEADIDEADVILCNNTLYHLSSEDAEALTWGMVVHLAVGGVMSFGAAKSWPMNGDVLYGKDHNTWRFEMSESLVETGITPLLSDSRGKSPYIFQQAA